MFTLWSYLPHPRALNPDPGVINFTIQIKVFMDIIIMHLDFSTYVWEQGGRFQKMKLDNFCICGSTYDALKSRILNFITQISLTKLHTKIITIGILVFKLEVKLLKNNGGQKTNHIIAIGHDLGDLKNISESCIMHSV